MRLFTRGLCSLLSAGLPLLPSLEALALQQDGPRARRAVRELAAAVSAGMPLSEAMEKQPAVFPKFVAGLVLVGEQTGTLAGNLGKIADHIDEDSKLRMQMYAAMTYPMILLGITGLGTLLLIKIFIPSFVPVFTEMRDQLPAPTRLLLFLTGLLSNPLFWLIFAAASAVFLLIRRMGTRDEEIRRSQDALVLNIPFVGKILRKGILAQITGTLAAAHAAGLSLPKSLELAAGVVENQIFRSFLQECRLALARGERLSSFLLAQTRLVSPLVGHMMAVAESTGETESLMIKCTRVIEGEMAYEIQRFSKLIEPAVLMLLGFIVCFIMIGVFLPLYSMLAVIR